jgi:hypothetical protein
MRLVSRRVFGVVLSAFIAALVVSFADVREAHAIPSFARKYQTSCQTCHTIYPVLNPFGEAFRRNGYRFPSAKGSLDSDAVKAPMIPMGQEEYKKTFPNSVWPSAIPESVPLSVMMNGGVPFNFPKSDAKTAAGNVFTWGGNDGAPNTGVVGEFHLFAAGAFSDTLTYFSQVTIPTAGSIDVETAYILWNDIVGPRHAINLWVGRLFAPQLTSFGLHSSYLSDTRLPAISIGGLYNSTASFTTGSGHTDGAELNGILFHRLGYSLGWVASSWANSLIPNAEDAYVHIGIKSGGVALDGEGKYGPNVPDPTKPWAERAITIDGFGYHGLTVLDNGTGSVAGGASSPTDQKDSFDVVGASFKAQFDSLILDSGIQVEYHSRPYAGSGATAVPTGSPIPGVPDYTNATAIVQWNELDYVLYPWLVPGVRTEFTRATVEGSSAASLLRIIPGVAIAIRPNVRMVLTGDLETATGMPVTGSWGPAGGFVVAPGPGQASKLEAEQINLTLSAAF